MEQCIWCKNEGSIDGYSDHKEPLCSDCLEKYRFGVSRGMITGSVLELSREGRRRVSDKRQTIVSLRRGIHGVEREVLVRHYKTLTRIIGAVLIVLFLLFQYYLYQFKIPEWQIFHAQPGWIVIFLIWLVVPPVLFMAITVPFFVLYKIIVWWIKYWQLTRG